MVLLALDSDGLALEFASPELREDREVVLRAVKADGEALQFARVFQELVGLMLLFVFFAKEKMGGD